MLKLNSRLFEDDNRTKLNSLLTEERAAILSRISRINPLEESAKVAFDYTTLRCALDVVEFMMYYVCVGDFPDLRRNYLCTIQVKLPVTYKTFYSAVKETMENLLRRNPTSSERQNSALFTTLYFLNQIIFED